MHPKPIKVRFLVTLYYCLIRLFSFRLRKVPKRSSVRDWTRLLLLNTSRSHVQNSCATGSSRSLATKMAATKMLRGKCGANCFYTVIARCCWVAFWNVTSCGLPMRIQTFPSQSTGLYPRIYVKSPNVRSSVCLSMFLPNGAWQENCSRTIYVTYRQTTLG